MANAPFRANASTGSETWASTTLGVVSLRLWIALLTQVPGQLLASGRDWGGGASVRACGVAVRVSGPAGWRCECPGLTAGAAVSRTGRPAAGTTSCAATSFRARQCHTLMSAAGFRDLWGR